MIKESKGMQVNLTLFSRKFWGVIAELSHMGMDFCHQENISDCITLEIWGSGKKSAWDASFTKPDKGGNMRR
jgi:hypothetical protein